VSNAVTELLDANVAAGHGPDPAIVTPLGTTTYADLLERACRVGHALRSLGVEAEQRVAMLLHDSLDWAATFLGVLRIGAVAIPMNIRLPADRLEVLLRDSRAVVLVAEADLGTGLAASADRLPFLRACLTPEALRAAASAMPGTLDPEPTSDDDMAFWLYTSGTTGTPKAAVHAHADVRAGRLYGADVLGIGPDDRVFATSKLFFAYALGNALLLPALVGARTFLHPAWASPESVAAVLADFQPTLFFSVPTFYAHLVRSDLPADTFGSLRSAVSAGERLPEEIHRAFRGRFGVEILDGVGATETIYMFLSNRRGTSRPGSCGTPVSGSDVRLVSVDGEEVAGEGRGVLHVRTPSASTRYWNRADASRRAFAGGWFRTGDVYTRDADGFYHHRGREDDLFKVAGMWVSPGDIEGVLLSHPAVVDAGVVGAPDASGLVKPFAFVVPRSDEASTVDLVDDLRRLAAARLATHAQPRSIVLVDALPRTATGKLQRFALRERVPS
jgi:benzoate-CoA ligase family protein